MNGEPSRSSRWSRRRWFRLALTVLIGALAAVAAGAYFGEHAYGAWAACERYFGIRPSRLDIALATLLAGLIQAPSAYDPFAHPAAAPAGQVEVLRALVRTGFLTDIEPAAALARPLQLRRGSALPPVGGLDLAPGPAFVWWQLALGVGVAASGLPALFGLRLPRLRVIRLMPVLRLVALIVILFGAAGIEVAAVSEPSCSFASRGYTRTVRLRRVSGRRR
jgi:transglycosylase-like protein